MSRERQKARAARQAAQLAIVEAAARRRTRRAGLLGKRPTFRKRPVRYGALPLRARLQLLAVFVAVQALAWQFVHGLGVRGSVAVLTGSVLLVLATTRKHTRQRSTSR